MNPVVNRFWKRRTPRRTLTLRSRGDQGAATRVDFAELAPELPRFLGQAAYLQLGYFETLTRLIRATPELSEKESLSRAAGAALTKHRAIVDLIAERGDDPTQLMLPFRENLDAFRRKTIGARPRETLLAVYITAGMLDDFYFALASSYGGDRRAGGGPSWARTTPVTRSSRSSRRPSTATRSGGRSCRCGRAAWSATRSWCAVQPCVSPELAAMSEDRVELVYTELMGAHARRMDAMGLAS